jgi:hypothetical protein
MKRTTSIPLASFETEPRDAFDLVVCFSVHIAGSVPEMITRLATGVAPHSGGERRRRSGAGGPSHLSAAPGRNS